MRWLVLLTSLAACLAWKGFPSPVALRSLRGGSLEASSRGLRKVLVRTPALSKRFLDRKAEIFVPGNATVGQLKDAICERFPGKPPRSLLRVYFANQELLDEEEVVPEELFEMHRPTVTVDLLLTTSGRDSRRQIFQEVDRLSSPEERIEAYAATYAALKFYMDLFEASDVFQAFDQAIVAPERSSDEEDVGKDEDEAEEESHEDAEVEEAAPTFRVNSILARMKLVHDYLEGKLQAHRDEEERLAPLKAQKAREEKEEADDLSALIRKGSFAGRLQTLGALNFNADLRTWMLAMGGLIGALQLNGVAPQMRPAMFGIIAATVGFQTRPIRYALKIGMNMMPRSAVAFAGSFLSLPQVLILTHDRKQVIEDLYGKDSSE